MCGPRALAGIVRVVRRRASVEWCAWRAGWIGGNIARASRARARVGARARVVEVAIGVTMEDGTWVVIVRGSGPRSTV